MSLRRIDARVTSVTTTLTTAVVTITAKKRGGRGEGESYDDGAGISCRFML